MKTKLIGCASTMNEVRGMITGDNIESEFLDYSYHANPVRLHKKLQEIINNSQEYDLIILTFGRCSNAVVGLVSPRVPMLLPGTHDCIDLLLGSNGRYTDILHENKATYFFSQGWLDYGKTPYDEYNEYVEKYGEKTAGSLINALYGRYKRALLITTPDIRDLEGYRRKVREIADFFCWEVDEAEGDVNLLKALVSGQEFTGTIFVPAGETVTEKMLRPPIKIKK